MTKTGQITSTIKSSENNESVVLVIVSQALVQEERAETIEHMALGVTIKGFRQGKAPLNLVEDKLDPQKVTDHILDHLFPKILASVFEEHKITPLSYPKAKIIKIPNDSNWEIELTIPLKPKLELGDYKALVKKTNESKKVAKDDNQRLQIIFDALIEKIKIEVPPSLVEDEVNHSLSRLLQQTQTLGLSLDEYLKSIGKTPEEIRGEYAKAATQSIKLELILDAISLDLKIEVPQNEIEAMIQASGDQEAKKRLDTDSQRRHIGAILKQRKTLDALLQL